MKKSILLHNQPYCYSCINRVDALNNGITKYKVSNYFTMEWLRFHPAMKYLPYKGNLILKGDCAVIRVEISSRSRDLEFHTGMEFSIKQPLTK